MKYSSFCSLLFLSIVMQSCNQSQNQVDGQGGLTRAEKPILVEDYKAIYQEDTINLKINTLKSGKITGEMEMKIAYMPVKEGKIAGELKGDTLFASYTFIQGGYEKRTFKNPMAFLKRDNQFILGNGKIQTTMGASYFVKGEPIDFEHVKYKFTKIEAGK